MSILNGIKEKVQKQKEIKNRTANNPRFRNMDVAKIRFYPIDGDVDRMKLYGCYAGDKFTYQDKEYVVEKDDVEKLTFIPSCEKLDIEKYNFSEFPRKKQDLWKQFEQEEKQRMYLGDFHPNDIIKSDLYQFKYISQDIMREVSISEGIPIGHICGWEIQCIDKTTPLKDVMMPDSLLGIDIVSADGCFNDCYNVASVKHISESCFKHNRIQHMFTRSGLRELPQDLNTDVKMRIACGNALCLDNFEDIMKQLNPYSLSYTAYGKFYDKEKTLIKAKENLDRDESLLKGEFSPYQKFEKVSFEYGGEPLVIIIAVDTTNVGFAVNDTNCHKETMIPFKEYIRQLESEKMCGFTAQSFSNFPYEEGIEAILTADKNKIDCLNRELNIEKEKLFKKIQDEISKADKMQQGLDYTPSRIFEANTQNQHKDIQQEKVVLNL